MIPNGLDDTENQLDTVALSNVSRRRFLQGTAGLTLGISLPLAGVVARDGSAIDASNFSPNAFLRIATDNTVTVISKHLEMGQGAYTGLATIVAEELDADWSMIRVEAAPADTSLYNNVFWGQVQGTGSSTSMANSWDQLRTAGATARAMLVAAAARKWKLPAAEIQVREGLISHVASDRAATFGQLANLAAAESVPAEVALKDPAEFRLIGTQRTRTDSQVKVDGSAVFTQDVSLPGMLVAVIAHAPLFGATVASFDEHAARAVNGVVDVVQIPQGVAVLAHDTWTAIKGRDALLVEWDTSAAFKLGSEEILSGYHQLAETAGVPVRTEGDFEQSSRDAVTLIEAAYDFPYLAHATMEPMNCVVQRTAGGCEVWNGEQFQTADQYALAALFGIAPAQVTIHMLYAGGSFGRRASKDSDYLLEAAQIVKARDDGAPVKLIWTREDDMRAGYYRPAFHHRLSAALDSEGHITGWSHRLVGQSILKNSQFEALIKDGVDPLSVEGADRLPYLIPNLRVDLHSPEDIGVPVQWWRSVGSSHNAFSIETFIDRIASELGRDPLAYRLEMLEDSSRLAGVLRLVGDKAAWEQPLAEGPEGTRRGRGVALFESYKSFVAQVAEVSITKQGEIRVDRVVCAVDCGIAINPDTIRAQVEGSVAFALSAALRAQITLVDGRVQQSNFHDYSPIRFDEMPRVEVHIVNSSERPTGIGEPGVPPLAPAVANAIAAATGRRLVRMPFDTALLKI